MAEPHENGGESQDPIPATEVPPTEVDPAAPRHPSGPPSGAARAASAARLGAASVKDLPTKASVGAQRAAASVGSLSLAVQADPLGAYEALARAPRLADLVALALKVVGDAARQRSADWANGAHVGAAAEEAKLSRADAETKFGNALDVLSNGGDDDGSRALGGALWAHAVAESPRKQTDDEDRVAGDILWLAAHGPFDATPLLDRALGDDASDLWVAIAGRIRQILRGRGAPLGRAEVLLGAAALAGSTNDRARTLAADLARDVKDPVLLRVLGAGTPASSASTSVIRLDGELVAAPRGLVTTAILGCTGILFALHAARFLGRVALAYRRPAEVSFSEAGVRVKARTELLGRTLREREHVIVRAGLARVVREVRFPRAAFYAGLLALAIGSWIGVRAFVDGVRAASPSLLLVGLVVVVLGVAADFVLGSILPGTRGRTRVLFVPKTGAALCIADVDATRADAALRSVL